MHKLLKVFLFGVSLTLAFWLKHAYLGFDLKGSSPEHELFSFNNELLDVRAFVKSTLGNAYDHISTIKQTSIPEQFRFYLWGFRFTNSTRPIKRGTDFKARVVCFYENWTRISGVEFTAAIYTPVDIYKGFMARDGITESQFREASKFAMSDEASTNLAKASSSVTRSLEFYQESIIPDYLFYLTLCAATVYYFNRKNLAKACLMATLLVSVVPLFFLFDCHSKVKFDIPHYAGVLFDNCSVTKDHHGVVVQIREMTALIGYLEQNIFANLALALASFSLLLVI